MDEIVYERWLTRAQSVFLALANARTNEEQFEIMTCALQDAYDEGSASM